MKRLIVLAVAALAVGCPEDKESDGGGGGTLTVTASATSVVADGTNTVDILVSGGGTAPITVTTTKGTFVESGTATASIAGTSGAVTLLTCDSLVSTTCTGYAAVSARDNSSRSGFISILFLKAEVCDNGADDDGDGDEDCADTDCTGAACTTGTGASGSCTAGACVCTMTSATEVACSDGTDDDCDGDIDCADGNCTGQNCLALGGGIGTCTAGACTCTAAGPTETACGDAKDNDCDGQIDCLDTNCNGQLCAGGGTCSGTSCIPPTCTVTETPEATCDDSVDNDCDGDADCQDADCDAKQCDDLPSQVCVAGACTDTASGLSLEVEPVVTRMAADGVSFTRVDITLTRDGQPLSQTVNLTTTLGTLSATSILTDVSGKASVTLTAGTTGGTATITASPFGISYTATAAVVLEAIGELNVKTVQYPVMGIRGSGYREVNLVEVLVKDLDLEPFPAGLEVVFEHKSLGGSTISGPWVDTATCQAASGCYAYHTTTDANGVARVSLYSGTIAGPVSLSATAMAGGPARTLLIANQIAVVGARASGSSFSIVCPTMNVEALRETNCGWSLVDDQFICEARLQDRYGNMLGTATQVIFAAESTRVGQVATTEAYDPTEQPTDQPDLGLAVEIFGTLGGYLPQDVDPVPGEPSGDHDADGCGMRTHNPRDGLVTVIAITNGEEAFFDANGSGDYDAGEPFVDLPEPFVDDDDDGIRDAGEWYMDVNGNGAWDPPNLAWDVDTKIWTQTVVTFSGRPIGAVESSTPGLYLGSRAHGPDLPFVGACTPTPPHGAFAISPADDLVDPPIPATSATYQLFGADVNFNPLRDRAQYNFYMVEPANAISYYHGRGFISNQLGVHYAYWPCDVATGQCATRCTTGRCVMRSSIPFYSCGYSTWGEINGYQDGPDPGTICAAWTQELSPYLLENYICGTNN